MRNGDNANANEERKSINDHETSKIDEITLRVSSSSDDDSENDE